jgi:hypothetical protein
MSLESKNNHFRIEQFRHAAHVERAYLKLIHYNKVEQRRAHFSAWEQPQFFATELRVRFRSLR